MKNETMTPRQKATPGDIIIRFVDDLDAFGWWDPESRVILCDASLSGRELAITLLHELGHVLCGDHGDALDGTRDDEWIERWAQQSASLLDIVRPGPRSVPA